MRQIGAEKDDPLKRIQAEINEVEQREREHRAKLAKGAAKMMDANDSDFVDDAGIDTRQSIMSPISDGHSSLSSTPDKDPCSDSVSAFSDDSGISSASSPINGQSANEIIKLTPSPPASIKNDIKIKTPKYIRLNTVQNAITASATVSPIKTTTVSGVASKILTRTTSTPQIFVPGIAPRFQMNPAKKGLMQRFIATRGKIAAASIAAANNAANEAIKNDNNSIGGNVNSFASKRNNSSILTSLELNRPPMFMMTTEAASPPIIERDAQGKPIRRGFIPVEEKIQKELRDMRNRETELKRMRRESLRQSQPDLLDCVDHGVGFDSAGEDSEDEHCFMPVKLRSSKSISELCDALSQNTSLSPRETPSPHCHREFSNRNGLKPALSLAQLCDVDPEEAPSSHRLIAQWENIIQRNNQ